MSAASDSVKVCMYETSAHIYIYLSSEVRQRSMPTGGSPSKEGLGREEEGGRTKPAEYKVFHFDTCTIAPVAHPCIYIPVGVSGSSVGVAGTEVERG